MNEEALAHGGGGAVAPKQTRKQKCNDELMVYAVCDSSRPVIFHVTWVYFSDYRHVIHRGSSTSRRFEQRHTYSISPCVSLFLYHSGTAVKQHLLTRCLFLIPTSMGQLYHFSATLKPQANMLVKIVERNGGTQM